MIKHTLLCFGLLLFAKTFAVAIPEEPVIVPRPQSVAVVTGVFPHKSTWTIGAPAAMKNLALADSFGCPKIVPARGGKADVTFISAPQAKGDEAYVLEIAPSGITIKAQARAGWFYGFQTLLQIKNSAGKSGLPACKISDEPRFPWRGLMIDEGRHFYGKEEVKRLLDVMAIYKMNRFHWHLTDSEGWRIEIKKYPKLAKVGGIGDWTSFQKNPKNPDGKAQYYTQAEIKEIVAYAKARCIEIVPEIDMPGHASAMNRAYPEYDGGGNDKLPRFTVNPGKEETYRYLTDILTEVAALFPSPWLHFGGDEVHFANKGWNTSPDVKALMKRENLKNLKDVEWYFNRRMAGVIRKLGKTCAGWDEVVTAGLPATGTLVNWWRHDKPGILKQALEKNYSIVLCPRHPCYFDFIQDDSHKHGRRWDGFNPWERVYSFPDFKSLGVTATQSKQILGVQACVWGETVPTSRRMEYLTFPRLQVLAESAWTLPKRKDAERFREKSLPEILKYCNAMKLEHYNPLEPKSTPEIIPSDTRAVEYIDPAGNIASVFSKKKSNVLVFSSCCTSFRGNKKRFYFNTEDAEETRCAKSRGNAFMGGEDTLVLPFFIFKMETKKAVHIR